MSNLANEYKSAVAPALMKKFGYKSVMQIPKLDKVVINVGAGEAKDNSKVIDAIINDLGKITGQKAVPCKAKKSVANFKLREGMPIGAKVTLRSERMWEFTERFIATALPRIRDFHGIPNRGFDGRGNYTLGIKDHSIFPELVEASAGHSGMDITFVTSSNDNQAAKALLEALGMPFAGRA